MSPKSTLLTTPLITIYLLLRLFQIQTPFHSGHTLPTQPNTSTNTNTSRNPFYINKGEIEDEDENEKYGDYEAHRNWISITHHQPLWKWYTYDVEWWGMDYPPLTSLYHSFFSSLICPSTSTNDDNDTNAGVDNKLTWSWKGLDNTCGFNTKYRGNDDAVYILRTTTFVTIDLLIFATGTFALFTRLLPKQKSSSEVVNVMVCLVASVPLLGLVDYSHFQISNFLPIGLVFWSFAYLPITSSTSPSPSSSSNINDNGSPVKCAVCFCLALCSKQMSLYFSPIIFSYLLGWSLSHSSHRTKITRFTVLGCSVMFTFVIVFSPFMMSYYIHNNNKIAGVGENMLLPMLRRIFPLNRGLFEGKVSSIWCIFNLKPISILSRIDDKFKVGVSMILTVLLFVPGCVKVFIIGYNQRESRTVVRNVIGACTLSSISFFLASFQVHEKTVLFVLLPYSVFLLSGLEFTPSSTSTSSESNSMIFKKHIWINNICTLTCLPLFHEDGVISVAYACGGVYMGLCLVVWWWLDWLDCDELDEVKGKKATKSSQQRSALTLLKYTDKTTKYLLPTTQFLMLIIEISSITYNRGGPFASGVFPDIFEVLNVTVGFVCVCWVYVIVSVELFV